ncbi:MAG: hypothetical protein AAF804_00530 [Bacteroidota bacterium]
MRFVLRVILIAALSYLLGWLLPQWPIWPMVGAAFLIGLLLSQGQKRRMFETRKAPRSYGFLSGFIAVFLLWGILTFAIHEGNEGLLAGKMTSLLSQGAQESGMWMVFATALVGGILGGLGAMTGNLMGQALKSQGGN